MAFGYPQDIITHDYYFHGAFIPSNRIDGSLSERNTALPSTIFLV